MRGVRRGARRPAEVPIGSMRGRRWLRELGSGTPEGPRPISAQADASPGAAIGPSAPGQARSGIARRRARAVLNSIAQGQRAGRRSRHRRAERVSRAARLNSRRRSVLVVTIPAPRQAPLVANRPDGRWLRPISYFRSRIAFSAGEREPADVIEWCWRADGQFPNEIRRRQARLVPVQQRQRRQH